MNAYLLGALAFIAAMLVFIVQNDTQVSVQFINWKSSEISLAVVVIISACGGALITFLLDSYRAFKTGQKLRKLIKANQKHEEEIQTLKEKQSIPRDNIPNNTSPSGGA
ncbi:MAG: LapA family protein [Syntrophomonas sp.]|jgi:uncharacterized integral membrane protein|nr:LapA family protein [Syntrophomonas sp.]